MVINPLFGSFHTEFTDLKTILLPHWNKLIKFNDFLLRILTRWKTQNFRIHFLLKLWRRFHDVLDLHSWTVLILLLKLCLFINLILFNLHFQRYHHFFTYFILWSFRIYLLHIQLNWTQRLFKRIQLNWFLSRDCWNRYRRNDNWKWFKYRLLFLFPLHGTLTTHFINCCEERIIF